MNKIFYGGIFMEQDNLKHNGIYHPIKIDYYKTEQKNEEFKNGTLMKYGIEVVKTEYINEEPNIEINNIDGISESETEIDKILKILKENEVTPVIAEDVISDYLYE